MAATDKHIQIDVRLCAAKRKSNVRGNVLVNNKRSLNVLAQEYIAQFAETMETRIQTHVWRHAEIQVSNATDVAPAKKE